MLRIEPSTFVSKIDILTTTLIVHMIFKFVSKAHIVNRGSPLAVLTSAGNCPVNNNNNDYI